MGKKNIAPQAGLIDRLKRKLIKLTLIIAIGIGLISIAASWLDHAWDPSASETEAPVAPAPVEAPPVE